MGTIAYPYEVRDSANTSTDNRKTGLTPTISNGKTLAAIPAIVTALGNVSVVEIGAGMYAAFYDAEAHGDAAFPVDWGASLTNPNDRYGSLVLARGPGRVLAALTGTGDLAGKVLGGGSGTIAGVGVNANVAEVNGETALDQSLDKTGYKLASDGLNAIAVPTLTGPATTFPGYVYQVWRRFFKKVHKTPSSLVGYADDGSTPVTTQTVSDNGSGTQDIGNAS